MKRTLFAALFAVCVALPAMAQTPRINALFPAGGRTGETVEVAVRGGNLVGAKRVLVTGAPGVTAELTGDSVQIDEAAKPLFAAKCTSCHEGRSPANRTLSVEQWAQTVDRMISARGADIAKPDRDKIVGYLQAMAKAGEIKAKVTVDKTAVPGFRELRVLTDHGVSTAYTFEVGALPEVTAKDSTTREAPQKVELPVVVNGAVSTGGRRDWFSFEAKKGERLTFNLKGFRLNEQSQGFFNPALFLYDAKGREVGKDLGRFGLDPVIDWTAPDTGTYTLLVRDLVWRGSPASVYRLAMGPLPYDGVLAPISARPGATVSARMVASVGAGNEPFTLTAPDGMSGVTSVSTPMGEATLLVRDLPDGGQPKGANASEPASLPAIFRGLLTQAGQVDAFKVKATRGGTALEVYAKRLGSPVRPKITVRDAKGNVVRERTATGNEDFRLENAFPQPGEYVVEVTDADGNGGTSFAYCWEALDGSPDFALTVTPDGANLQPGGSLPLLVRATRRENIKGPIALSVTGLPAGVTASPAMIAENDDKAVIVVTAATDAAVTGAVVSVQGQAVGANDGEITRRGDVVRRARPLELTRINNNQRPFERNAQIIAVGAEGPPFTLSLDGNVKEIALEPNKEEKTHRSHYPVQQLQGRGTCFVPRCSAWRQCAESSRSQR